MKTAHAHLLSVLGAELSIENRFSPDQPIRILDIGCGYGQLMIDLLTTWPEVSGRLGAIELYGYEVYDHRAGTPGYLGDVLGKLASVDASLDWGNRVRLGAAGEAWPFEDGFFDYAVSNQVLEHVADLGHFFSEQSRVLKKGGGAAHFYPSRETLVEPHSGVPAVHWLDKTRRRDGLLLGSRLGLGKVRRYRREQGRGIAAFCDEFDQYLERYVFFRGNGEIRAEAESFCEQAGFKYTRPLVERALLDDWDAFAYPYAARSARFDLAAPFVCSTLVQGF